VIKRQFNHSRRAACTPVPAMKRKQASLRRAFAVLLSNERAQAAEMALAPGKTEGGADNRHRGADQWLFVVSGTGQATVNGRKYPLRAGTLLLIERGDEHQIENTGRRQRLQTLNVYVPPAYSAEGDELPAGRK
jgi:mannose-6-phosphate isomerase-like protein (cupin superfamily)